MSIFPVQLTTGRISNLTRLISTLLYVMTIQRHTYHTFPVPCCYSYSSFSFKICMGGANPIIRGQVARKKTVCMYYNVDSMTANPARGQQNLEVYIFPAPDDN